jgi:hypothetical protein
MMFNCELQENEVLCQCLPGPIDSWIMQQLWTPVIWQDGYERLTGKDVLRSGRGQLLSY